MRPLLTGLMLAIVLAVGACGPGDGPRTGQGGTTPPDTGSGTPGATEFVEPPPPPAPSGMPQIRVDDLPAEAIAVLDLIEQGGPYPYEQDGAVFENREGLLPSRPRGHYREYTVETPGEDDRGARRIVAGADGERFWTRDHYASFEWIAE